MARTARALGAVIVLAGLALATTGSAWAAFPGEDDQISFGLGTPTGDFQIATMRPDGSDVRVLARNPKNTFVFDSAWSADGRWIAFDRLTTNAGGSIWRVRRDGSHQQLVIAGSRSTGSLEPSWSPDGRWIVYAHFTAHARHLQIWASHPNGTDAHRVIATNGDDDWPRYSPNGRWIAFSESVAGAHSGIAIARADGTHVRRLAATRPLDSFGPDWSPDGRSIAFASNAVVGLSSIYTIHADGSGLRRITRPGRPHYNDLGAAWSPQGDQIAFARNPCPNATQGCPLAQVAIWVIGTDGSHPHAITHNLQNNYVFPNWGPAPR